MRYIDNTYYLEDFGGKPLDTPNDLDRLIKRASTAIQTLTKSRVAHDQLLTFHPVIQDKIKLATATLVEHYDDHDLFTTSSEDGFSSVGIGSFNYTENKDSNTSKVNVSASDIPQSVIDILAPTGLLYAGVRTVGG